MRLRRPPEGNDAPERARRQDQRPHQDMQGGDVGGFVGVQGGDAQADLHQNESQPDGGQISQHRRRTFFHDRRRS